MIIDQLFTRPIFEAADPSRLIVSVRIEPMSTGGEPIDKEVDLTGQFQGSMGSQMNQALDYMKKMLESKGFYFTTLRVNYQGKSLGMQNRGSMEPQSDEERDLDSMANQMRAKQSKQTGLPAVKENKSDPITQFASNAHEQWRRNFDPTGTKPRIKKNSDGTEGDINVPFADLHPDWQKENLAAGHAAHRAVKHFGHDMEKAAEYVHSEWMKRNPKADYNAAQHVPYDDLSDDEKEKDRVHVRTMMRLMGHHPKQGVDERIGDLRKFSHKKNRFRSLDKLQNPLGEEDAIDPSRRGFLKKAAGAAVAGAAMSAAGPEIVTLVKGFAEQAGGMNGIQALKAMLKIATADELYNMYDYQADSGILADAITDSDMRALQRVKGFRDYEDWSDFEEYCEDNNDVDPVEEFERLTGRSLKVSLVNDILEKVDDTWSLEDFFDEYPDALKLINPFDDGSISRPTMQQLAHIDTAAKGASLPAPIVTMANAVAGLVRQIFKANGQPLSAPQQVAQTSRAAPALPAPARPEFDMTPDLKTKQQVPVQRKGDDEEQGVTEAAQGHTIEAHGVRGMDRRTWHKTFRNTDQMMAWAEKHDAEIIGTRDLEQARHGNLSPAQQGVAEDEFDSFKFGKPITFSAYHSSKSEIKRILPTDEFYFSDDRHTWEDNYLYKIKITLKNPYVMLDQKAEFESHARVSLPKIKAAGHDGVIYTPYSVDYGFRQGVCFYPQRQISSIKLVNQNITGKQGVAKGLTEMDKSQTPPGRDTGPRSGPDQYVKPITSKQMQDRALDKLNQAVKDSHKKKDVKEGILGSDPNRGQKVPDWAKGGIIGKIGRKLDPAWSDVQITVPQHLLSKKSDVPATNTPAAKDTTKAASGTPTGAIPQRAGTYNPPPTFPANTNARGGGSGVMNPDPLAQLMRESGIGSEPLMKKLRQALVREGRVKELADDLKTMSDADFMKKYGKAKAAIRADMTRVDEARTDYTPDEMADMMSGKRSQKQIDADAERTRGPNKAPPTKESTQSRAKRLNEKLATSDTLPRSAAGAGVSRKKDIDFRTGLDVGDDESEFFEPDVRIGKPVERYDREDEFMAAFQGAGQQNADNTTPLEPGEFRTNDGRIWRFVTDPAAAPAKKEPQWIPSSAADSIASWKANNPGKSAADWGSIPAASKSSAVGGSPNMRWNSQTRAQEKLDPRTGTWVPVPADASGANSNIDAATRDRARAWAAQQNAPGAALAGAMRSSGNPVDTAKSKTDWKTIYNLNKSIIGDNPNSIRPGMKLKMPDGSTYRVQPGDNLSKIAAGQINELSTDKLAQYKTAAARDAKQADQEGDFKRGDRRFHGMVQATKKQFDNDAKKVDENRAARRALMARIVNHR